MSEKRCLEDVLVEQTLVNQVINLNADTRLHQFEEVITGLDDGCELYISLGIDVSLAEMILGDRKRHLTIALPDDLRPVPPSAINGGTVIKD